MRHYYILMLLLVFMASIGTSGCRKQDMISDLGRIRIDSISPGRGPAGTYFEVYGDNFTFQAKDVTATIGSVKLNVVSASVTKLLFKLPSNAVSGTLTLTFNRADTYLPNNGDYMEKTITSTLFQVDASAVPGPILLNATPASANAGRPVVLKGYNFSAQHDPQVWFGGIKAERTAFTDSTITVKMPAGVPVGESQVYVAQNGRRSGKLTFLVLKPLPEIDAVYFTKQGDVYESRMENGVFSKKILYNTGATGAYPVSIKADQTRKLLYWLDANTGDLTQAPMDGSGPMNVVYSYNTANYFILDYDLDAPSNKLYLILTDFNSETGIFELDLNRPGGTAKKLYNLPDENPSYLQSSSVTGKLYWMESAPVPRVVSANLDGSGNRTSIFEVPQNERIEGMYMDDKASKLYFCLYNKTGGQKDVVQVNLSDGKGRKALSANLSPNGMYIDTANGLIYWNDPGKANLYQTDTDGSFTEVIPADILQGESFTLSYK